MAAIYTYMVDWLWGGQGPPEEKAVAYGRNSDPRAVPQPQLLDEILRVKHRLRPTITQNPRIEFPPRHPVVAELTSRTRIE